MARIISSRTFDQLQIMVAQTAQLIFKFSTMVGDRTKDLRACFRVYVSITKAILPGARFAMDIDILASTFYVIFVCIELRMGNIHGVPHASEEVPAWSFEQVPHTPICSSCC